MEITASSQSWQSIYKILIGAIVPRPIGWISTVDIKGLANLAPFSFFNIVCANPPLVLFCPMIRSTDIEVKDTLRNARATGEFIVNITTETLASAVNLTATELPSHIDEFEYAGVSKTPGKAVNSPRVAESPVHLECKVAKILEFGEGPGSGSVVIGEVVHIHVDEAILIPPDKIDIERLKPIGRLSGHAYCRVNDIFNMIRPTSQINRGK